VCGYIDPVIVLHSTRCRISRGVTILRDKHVGIPKRKHDNLPL
jgi:propionyl-CoA carboxylase beta chain